MGEQGGKEQARRAYWRANLRLMAVLLLIWFAVSFGFGILLREQLDAVSIGGVPLGFWFAQQGAMDARFAKEAGSAGELGEARGHDD